VSYLERAPARMYRYRELLPSFHLLGILEVERWEQFEGWPAIQFSGWPEIAVGTFGAIVSSVDSAVSENGKFRIIATKDPDENWPNSRFLNHGAKVYGWILLDNVKLGYELWRKINGFPPDFNEQIKSQNFINYEN
jgi:hypothetical protein